MEITLAGGAVTYEPNDDQLGRVSLEFAAIDGEVGVGQLPVPDSTAALTVADGRSARVDEIATRLTDGFIIDQDRVRGPQPAATAREHSYSVQDANALLDGFRIARKRPSETDYARVIAFAAADGPSWDTTWVLNANTVTMPAKRYYSDGGWTSELIPDVVEFTGKTLFLHDKSSGGRCLHYHTLGSGHTCGLTISDVPSAVNGVTVFAPGQPTRNRTSVDLWNSVKGVDQANRTYIASDSTSIATHDADGLQHELQVSFEATSQADLQVKTAAYLASFKDERDTYTCTIGPLDATALTLIRVGDLITTTSSVMGLTASPQRIAHMTLSVWTGADGPPAPGLWQAALELGAPIRRRARVTSRDQTRRTEHEPSDTCSDPGATFADTFTRTTTDTKEYLVANLADPDDRDLALEVLALGQSDTGHQWHVRTGYPDFVTLVSSHVDVTEARIEFDSTQGLYGDWEATVGNGGVSVVSYASFDFGFTSIDSGFTLRADFHLAYVPPYGIQDAFDVITLLPTGRQYATLTNAWEPDDGVTIYIDNLSAVSYSEVFAGGVGSGGTEDLGVISEPSTVHLLWEHHPPDTSRIRVWFDNLTEPTTWTEELTGSIPYYGAMAGLQVFLEHKENVLNAAPNQVITIPLLTVTKDYGCTQIENATLVSGGIWEITTPYRTGTTVVFLNTVWQEPVTDYTETSDRQITFVTPPGGGSTVRVCYVTNITIPTGIHGQSYGPVPVQETPNGVLTTFTIPPYIGDGYVPGTLHVWVDGMVQNKTETSSTAGTFTLTWAPATGDEVTAAWVIP